MHLKNLSIIYSDNNTIALSPAYDLLSTQLVLPEDNEDLALTLNGKKKNITKNDFYKFAEHCLLSEKVIDNIFSDFESALTKFPTKVRESFLLEPRANDYLRLVYKKAHRLYISTPIL